MLIQGNALVAGAWRPDWPRPCDANRNLLAPIQTVRRSRFCAGRFVAAPIVTPRAYGFVYSCDVIRLVNRWSNCWRAKPPISPTPSAYMFLDDRDGEPQITFGELDRRARLIAARLQLELKQGDRALLVYPAGLEFISAFLRLHVRGRRRGAGDVSEAEAADAAAATHRGRLRCPRGAVDRSDAHDA